MAKLLLEGGGRRSYGKYSSYVPFSGGVWGVRGRGNGGPRPSCRVMTYDVGFRVKEERLRMDV